MARFARVVVAEVPHHITQRGNARQVILGNDADRATYLTLLRQYSELRGLGLAGGRAFREHYHKSGCPILRALCEGWAADGSHREPFSHAVRTANEIFVHPSFTRTNPGSSRA